MYQNRLCSVETTFKIYLLFGTVFSNLKTKVKTSRRNTTNYFLFPGSGHRLLSVFSGLQQEQNCWQVLANRFQLQFWFPREFLMCTIQVRTRAFFPRHKCCLQDRSICPYHQVRKGKKHKDREIDVMLTFSVTSWHLIFERHICSNLKVHSIVQIMSFRLWDSKSTQVRLLGLSIFNSIEVTYNIIQKLSICSYLKLR